MRERYQEQLLQLNESLLNLSKLCEDSISYAIDSFILGDKSLADKAMQIEANIDELEKDIERQCMSILLKQQPMAGDLRIVSAGLKMITDLERIGDHAEDIASISKNNSNIEITKNIKQMSKEVMKMLLDAVDSYVKQDLSLAVEVIRYDDVVDDLFNLVKQEIIQDIKGGQKDAEATIDTLMVAKYLERIGDHATNVAEWVVFAITGQHDEVF